jgi:acetyl-CoA synthetase
MGVEIIDERPGPVVPNLGGYAAAREAFGWAKARAALEGLPNGGLNIAHEAVIRHARGPERERIAIRWLGKRGQVVELSYAELDRETARFANALASLGIARGEAVFALLGRVPELYVAALGTLRHGAVFCPLFSAFGPEPIASRLRLGHGKLLVTSTRLYERKVKGLRPELDELRHVLVTPSEEGESALEATLRWEDCVAPASSEHEVASTRPEDPALLHFTSGTTGAPKGAVHVHEALVMHHLTGRYALDLHEQDRYWCTADPGWVTGTSYGIVAPLSCGVTMLVDEAEFDAERWYDILERERVSVFYTAPTAIRMLMKVGPEPAKRRDLSSLRFCASVGEPLAPEAVRWGRDVLGHAFHDNWWQTETGGIMIANYAGEPIRPGSMGRPMPGIEAAIIRRTPEGGIECVEEPGVEGELALRAGWPSMFRAYLGAPERYAKCFSEGWYLSGDLAKRDADGYFWFVGRGDDVIKSAGHLIGPFEVEAVLLEHPAVAEAGVIGIPDPVAGELVKAFVALKNGYERSEALERELIGHARKRLGPAVAPKELSIVDSLPRTKSGKILRRLLKARELGLPEGDTSTLEST